MTDIEWVKGCPERNKRYVIPTTRGDFIVVRVSTPDIFAVPYNTMPYEEYEPVEFDGDKWHCLDWNGDRNEFVLALACKSAVDDELFESQVRSDLLAIVYGEMSEVFQMVLL